MRRFALLLALSLPVAARAQVINAASCSATDVQTAFSAVTTSTTTINIPSCPSGVAWTTAVTLTVPSGNTNLTVIGAGSQSIIGGNDQTVIIDNVSHSPTDNAALTITTNSTSTSKVRISGITIKSDGSSSASFNGSTVLLGSSANVRIDHSHFAQLLDGKQMKIAGCVYGVMDSSVVDLTPASTNNGVFLTQGNCGGDSLGVGNGQWNEATNLGSAQSFYFENNIFNGGTNSGGSGATTLPFADDCSGGGRFVFRFNTLNGVEAQGHATGHATSPPDRSCRSYEIYQNTYGSTGTTSATNPGEAAFFNTGGTGVVWGNNATGSYKNFIEEVEDRANNATYTQAAPPAGWGYCSTTPVGGVVGPSNWDQNTSGQNGWACLDQVGRGVGDLLQGSFPNVCDATSTDCTNSIFTGRWPNQALEPVYEWLNQWHTPSGWAGVLWSGDGVVTLPNRDFYLYTLAWSGSAFTGTSFNGTVGTGSGTRSARPSTCTVGVAYWSTDQGSWNSSGGGGQGVLDKCTATNTWTNAAYTPLAYPHPLVIASVATPTASPVAGTYAGTQTITLSTSTGGATMCYTEDGSTPTANGAGTCTHGTTYSSPFTVTLGTTTVKAIGSLSGDADSAVFSGTYVITNQTWFTRADGGTRYVASTNVGQCDGLADVAYPGSGLNQHCAFNDARYLWVDNQGSNMAWIISGGDTVVIRGCAALGTQQNPSNPNCRLGWDNDSSGNPPGVWCGFSTPNTNCFPPPVPSGTSGAHTRILGGCAYDATPGPCNTGNVTNHGNLTQLFSGFGLGWALSIRGSTWVDFAGLEFTTHNKVSTGTAFTPSGAYTSGQIIFDGTNTQAVTVAGTAGSTPTWNPTVGLTTTTGAVTFLNEGPNCIRAGSPAYPVGCQHGSIPFDDYGDNGIFTSNTTGNITFTDMWIHGFSASGLYGAIGGAITFTRANISFNAFAGWNFDEGPIGPNSTGIASNPLASFTASYLTGTWNGCNQEYPMIDPIPCLIAYSITNGGFGDFLSGQDTNIASIAIDHGDFEFNVKDPFFGPHLAPGSVTITDSYAANNGGQTWKSNLGLTGAWLMQNTLTDGNCGRLRQAVTGAPSTFNLGIASGDTCRADGATYSMNWPINGSFEIDNSTFVSASVNVGFDLGCWTLATGISTITNGGSGYTVGDLIYLGGGGTTVTVTSVGSGGVITAVSLTTAGQVVNPNETYNFDSNGSGTGAIFQVSTTPATCNGGPRILRNTNFIGYTNTNNSGWNGQTINVFCYSSCQGQPGDSDDTQWTIRSHNNFFQYQPGNDGACTYPGETCVNPVMVAQPSQTWVSETQLDSFNPTLPSSSNSFYPASGSPLIAAGVAISGITKDFFGVTRPNPPAIGGVEPNSTTPPSKTNFINLHLIGNAVHIP